MNSITNQDNWWRRILLSSLSQSILDGEQKSEEEEQERDVEVTRL